MSLPFKSDGSAYMSPLNPKSNRFIPKSKSFFSRQKLPLLLILIPCIVLSFIFVSPLRGLILTEYAVTPMVDDPSLPEVMHYDLADSRGSAFGGELNERILYLVPLRDAAPHLPMFFSHMELLSYPHNLIDLAFLVSDSSDNTLPLLNEFLNKLQSNTDTTKRFGSIEIFEKDFGQSIGQGFSDRHGFAAQGPRRKLMAKARNWLLSAALKPDHSWVYWRDADVQTVPPSILEDLMKHDKDVIVPNIWRPLPDWLGNEQPYDLNSWQESEAGLQLAETLDEDAVIVEGYPEYATWRPHLAYLRDPYGDIDVEMELDGIGGVSILARARVFRTGSHFPAFSFKKHAETEGFGKMSKHMGFSVIGLPHYTIWHIYEPSSDDIKHMAWMAEEEDRREQEKILREAHDKNWKDGFEEIDQEWFLEKENIMKNTDIKIRDGDSGAVAVGAQVSARKATTAKEATAAKGAVAAKEAAAKEAAAAAKGAVAAKEAAAAKETVAAKEAVAAKEVVAAKEAAAAKIDVL